MEDVFSQLKSENELLSKKIPALKNKQLMNSKELEAYSFNKKHPNQVILRKIKE